MAVQSYRAESFLCVSNVTPSRSRMAWCIRDIEIDHQLSTSHTRNAWPVMACSHESRFRRCNLIWNYSLDIGFTPIIVMKCAHGCSKQNFLPRCDLLFSICFLARFHQPEWRTSQLLVARRMGQHEKGEWLSHPPHIAARNITASRNAHILGRLFVHIYESNGFESNFAEYIYIYI